MSEIKLPEVELNIYSTKNPVEVPIIENWICTKAASPNFVRHITFDISSTELEGRIRVGQAVGILPPGEDGNGRPHKLRLYSISSPTEGENGNPSHISTTVKRVIEEWEENDLYLGVCSNYLADLSPGDVVRMTGPSGRRFLLPENAGDFNYVFLATGTGIAPFRGMVMELLESGIDHEVVLVFGCPYRTDILYPDYFEPLHQQYPNFHYLPYVSREDRRADGSKKYVQTCLWDDAGLLDPILEQDNTLLYICGLKGMEGGIYRSLAKKGLHQYMELKEEVTGKDPDTWDERDLLRNVKPSPRTFVEVY